MELTSVHSPVLLRFFPVIVFDGAVRTTGTMGIVGASDGANQRSKTSWEIGSLETLRWC